MDFSVIICTYNRAENLPECLKHLAGQKGTEGLNWEVLVVDNNSTDNTRAIVRDIAEKTQIQIRYVFEKEQGLNYARNRGVMTTRGKYFAFIDDDIIVGPDWLASMHDALLTYDADATGGRIHLEKSICLPSWIQVDMYGFLGYQDYGDEPFQMDGFKKYPFGGNMAFNRRVVDRIGLFNPKVGRKGAGRKRGELFKGAETEYFQRLAAIGAKIFYQPAAVVYHKVLPFQMKKRYFRTIHYNAGMQMAIQDSTNYTRTFWGVPIFLYRLFFRAMTRYLRQLLTMGINRSFRQQMTVRHFYGQIRGYAALQRRQ